MFAPKKYPLVMVLDLEARTVERSSIFDGGSSAKPEDVGLVKVCSIDDFGFPHLDGVYVKKVGMCLLTPIVSAMAVEAYMRVLAYDGGEWGNYPCLYAPSMSQRLTHQMRAVLASNEVWSAEKSVYNHGPSKRANHLYRRL